MKILLFASATLILIACSSAPKTTTHYNPEYKSKFTVVASMNRYLNLEQCGCSFNPQGGLDWEWHVWDKWRKENIQNPLFLTGGSTFFYYDPHGPKLTQKEQMAKAKFLVQGLNALNLDGVGLTANDLSLGVENLKKLKKESRSAFVATNLKLNDKTLAEPYHLYERDGAYIAVISLSAKSKKALPNGVKWVSPLQAMKEVSELFPKEKKYLLVVLSNLPYSERKEVLEQYPDIHLWIGEDQDQDFSLAFDPVNAKTLFVHPEYFGRKYARLDVSSNSFNQGYYIPSYRDSFTEMRAKTEKGLSDVMRSLASNGSDEKARIELQVAKRQLEQQLLTTDFLLNKNSLSAMQLYPEVVAINKKFDLGRNPISEIIDQYRKELGHDGEMDSK